jgi:flagellum-specific peptidoglycan hydrolase FlgJ
MEKARILHFLARYWFRLLLGVVAIIVLLRKDVNFQIRIKAPTPTEEAIPKTQDPAWRTPARKPSEKLTEVVSAPPDEPREIDRFEMPILREGDKHRKKSGAEWSAIGQANKQAFLERFRRVALAEQEKFDIPASLTLGHALLFSLAGNSAPARAGNNFFELGCTDDWRGATLTSQGRCYRRYENAWTSFRDHSLFLSSGKFAGLKEQAAGYRTWVDALEKKGFYADKRLGRQVLEIIEQYELWELDR